MHVDGLSITATSLDATITTRLAEAEADGEVALPAERRSRNWRGISPPTPRLPSPADDRTATVTYGESRIQVAGVSGPRRSAWSRISSVAKPAASSSMPGSPATCLRGRHLRPANRSIPPVPPWLCLHNTDYNLLAVAADGFRFCRITTPATTTLSADQKLIIPSEMVKTINRLLAESRPARLHCADPNGCFRSRARDSSSSAKRIDRDLFRL